MKILNLLWDVDGTLFDTYPAITFAISKSLFELGQNMAMNMIDGLVRQSIDFCLESLSQRFKIDADMIRDKAGHQYLKIPLKNQPPFPGVRDVCMFIQKQGGVNVAVAHRCSESVHQLLKIHGLAPFFADILSIEQGYPRLPDPHMILAALEKKDLSPSETLMIGDRELEIQAGRSAGIRTCLFGSAQISIPVEFQIEKYCRLLAILKEMNL